MLILTSCGGPRRPDILLIVLDTTAAEHLSCYGYERGTTPVIDSLASSGTMWANAQAQAPWTLPAMTSILTGLTVKTHGCRNYPGLTTCGLDPELPTLTTILLENGYRTAAFVNINYLGEVYGLNRDFQHFCYDGEGHGRARVTVDSLLAWLDSDDFKTPFFVFFHLFDPHLPYDPPEGYDMTFEPSGARGITDWRQDDSGAFFPQQVPHLINMYDGELRWTDSQLGRLFEGLRERGLTDDLIIVLTADHGEEFLQHGDWGHGPNLYQHVLHVPLIFSGHGIPAGAVDSTTVGQIDILPTLLNLAGIPVPDREEGLDLMGPIPPDRPVYSSGVFNDSTQASVVCCRDKVIWSPIDDHSEMFDLESDPQELEPMAADSGLLNLVLQYWAWPCPWEPTTNQLDVEERKRLEDLGYIR